jgi:hypothetical protein
MSKPFSELRDKMTPESQERASAQANLILAEDNVPYSELVVQVAKEFLSPKSLLMAFAVGVFTYIAFNIWAAVAVGVLVLIAVDMLDHYDK